MKKEIADRWVEALRSAKYVQGKKALCQKYTDGSLAYCCLGVLCEISGLAKFEGVDNCGDLTPARMEYLGSRSWLPNPVMEWAGIGRKTAERGNAPNLADMNDAGNSFEIIAGVIERNWEVL